MRGVDNEDAAVSGTRWHPHQAIGKRHPRHGSAGPIPTRSTPVMLSERQFPLGRGQLKQRSSMTATLDLLASFLGCSSRANGALSRLSPSSWAKK